MKFYRYQPGFMHHKVILVDDDLAAVGTANFDNRSIRLNFELMLVFADKSFAADRLRNARERFRRMPASNGGRSWRPGRSGSASRSAWPG